MNNCWSGGNVVIFTYFVSDIASDQHGSVLLVQQIVFPWVHQRLSYLTEHRFRIDLAHVSARVVFLYIVHLQLPRVVPIVRDGQPRIVSHQMGVNGQYGPRVRLYPSYLYTWLFGSLAIEKVNQCLIILNSTDKVVLPCRTEDGWRRKWRIRHDLGWPCGFPVEPRIPALFPELFDLLKQYKVWHFLLMNIFTFEIKLNLVYW